MSRTMSLERVVDYFKDANLDVAEITLLHVTNIVGKRKQTVAILRWSRWQAVR